ncbi:MAG: GvpL/GvpF family gas vesicle protein, partial [Deltaproteobacteria bacterium]|nr:GvpL/GvpF family gas vesicle protein [Deltaproteobacteria bacterium]
VEAALEEEKANCKETILSNLEPLALAVKTNNTYGERMIMNAAFLVDKGREKEFDNIMDDLRDQYKDRVRFMYAGPLPVFNFVNIVIYPEEWER